MSATADMKMLRRIKGATLLDRQRNEDISTELKVDCRLEKVQHA